jgi:hypothetical protein
MHGAIRPPSGFVEFKTDVVYPVRRDANGAGGRLRQLQDQEHRARYAKGPERRGRFERAQAFLACNADGFVSLFHIGREHIFDPFHEGADTPRQVAPMRDHQGHGERPATKIG